MELIEENEGAGLDQVVDTLQHGPRRRVEIAVHVKQGYPVAEPRDHLLAREARIEEALDDDDVRAVGEIDVRSPLACRVRTPALRDALEAIEKVENVRTGLAQSEPVGRFTFAHTELAPAQARILDQGDRVLPELPSPRVRRAEAVDRPLPHEAGNPLERKKGLQGTQAAQARPRASNPSTGLVHQPAYAPPLFPAPRARRRGFRVHDLRRVLEGQGLDGRRPLESGAADPAADSREPQRDRGVGAPEILGAEAAPVQKA